MLKDRGYIQDFNTIMQHRAISAWTKLGTDSPPKRVKVLKYNQTDDTGVCRLSEFEPPNENIIAKRTWRNLANIERKMYEHVLPKLPFRSLKFYGLTEDIDCNYCWLFIEEFKGEKYLMSDRKQRVAIAHWIGALHSSTSDCRLTGLPERGPPDYMNRLLSARQKIKDGLSNPTLKHDDLNLLKDINPKFDFLEAQWDRIEKFCSKIPKVVVHGDLRKENILVRNSIEGIHIVPIDWGESGWGNPAVDLTPSCNLDILAYWSVVRRNFPTLDIRTVKRLRVIGKIFRSIASIDWESEWLKYELKDRFANNMRTYRSWLETALLSEKIKMCVSAIQITLFLYKR